MSYHHFATKAEAKHFADEMYAKGHYVRMIHMPNGMHRVLVSFSC